MAPLTGTFKQQEREFEEQQKNLPWKRNTLTSKINLLGTLCMVTVTNCAADADQWIERHAWPDVWALGSHLGIAILWTQEGRSADYNKSSVIALATGTECLIMQLDHMDHVQPIGLRELLEDRSVHFAAFRAEDDVRERLKADHELDIADLVDLRQLAADKLGVEFDALRGMKEERIAMDVLGFSVPAKKVNVEKDSWDVKVLSADQIRFAAREAYLRRAIFHKLLWGFN